LNQRKYLFFRKESSPHQKDEKELASKGREEKREERREKREERRERERKRRETENEDEGELLSLMRDRCSSFGVFFLRDDNILERWERCESRATNPH